MPFGQSGGSLVTGANVVDGTIGVADLADSAKPSYAATDADFAHLLPTFRTTAASALTLSNNTTMYLGAFHLAAPITISKISLRINLVTVAGTVDLCIYSSTGATRHVSETSASISATGIHVHSLGTSVRLPAGVYYFAVNANSTTDLQINTYTVATQADADGTTGEAVLSGTLTITADTPPTTIDPTAITYIANALPIGRLVA